MTGAGQTFAVIESLIETQYIVGPTHLGQVGKTAPYLWVLSMEHGSQSDTLNFVVAVKSLENVCSPGYANPLTLLSQSVALWIS